MAAKTASTSDLITTAQAAKLLMIGQERVRQLVKDGYIDRPKRGYVTLDSAVQGYIRFLKDEDRRSARGAGESRVRDARAAEIEQRMAIKNRDLIPVEDAEAAVDAIVAEVQRGFTGLAARVTRDIPLRRTIEQEVNGIFGTIARRLEKAGSALVTGGDPFDAGADRVSGSVGGEE